MKLFIIVSLTVLNIVSTLTKRPSRVASTNTRLFAAMVLPSSAIETLKSATLAPIDIDDKKNIVELSNNEIKVSEVISKHAGTHGSMCFAVRRPGWPLCREEGLALSQLAARDDKPLEGIGLFGVVKETAVDDEGLIEFYSKYYPFPLYLDKEKAFYTSLGSRKISFSLLYKWLFSGIKKRFKAKNIDGNLKGEGLLQGGVILFSKKDEPVYTYQEKTGDEIPIKEIIDAVSSMKK